MQNISMDVLEFFLKKKGFRPSIYCIILNAHFGQCGIDVIKIFYYSYGYWD